MHSKLFPNFILSFIPWRENRENALQKLKIFSNQIYFIKMSGVSCVIFYAAKMLQTIEFPWVALNINLFEGPLYRFFFGVRLGI
jgi:hypothetical protein